MELMRDAGLTPMQIILAFSKNNSEMLGIDKDFGTLAKGKAADLLVLTANPLDDIANMRSIEAVYLGGKKFEYGSSELGGDTMKRIARLAASAAALSLAFGTRCRRWPRPRRNSRSTPPGRRTCRRTGSPAGSAASARASRTTSTWSTGATSPMRRRKPRPPRPRSSSSTPRATWSAPGATRPRCPARSTAASSTATRTSMSPATADAIVQKYAPDGKLLLQIGTRGKFDSVDGTRRGAGNNAAQGPAPHAVRHRGRSGQRRHLRLRRLRQPPRGRVRQGRQIPAPVGTPGDRRRNAEGRARRVRPGGALHRHEQRRA